MPHMSDAVSCIRVSPTRGQDTPQDAPITRPAPRLGPIACEQIEIELKRRSLLRLHFSAAIEERYEFETKAVRVSNLALLIPMGLVGYDLFSFVDATLMPDLGWIPTILRLFVITPVGLLALWVSMRLSAVIREAFLAFAVTGALIIPLVFIAVSKAPLAPYAMFPVLLSSMFGNITMRLRFRWACLFTILSIASVIVTLCLRTDLQSGLIGAILIATINCSGFGIVANYQLEWSERRSYLLALRETSRSYQLHADKAVFSALSLIDPLTGLANRRAFDAKLEQLWCDSKEGVPFALLMVDVDHFKSFNDRYGHPAGDACLCRVAGLLSAVVVRRGDLVARYGGEEFSVLVTDCGIGDAVEVGKRLCQAVAKAMIPHADRGDGASVVTISVGVAGSADAATPTDLVTRADRDLYAAKRAGRNRVGG